MASFPPRLLQAALLRLAASDLIMSRKILACWQDSLLERLVIFRFLCSMRVFHTPRTYFRCTPVASVCILAASVAIIDTPGEALEDLLVVFLVTKAHSSDL